LDLQNINALSLDYAVVKETQACMLLYATDAGTVNSFEFNEDKMAKVAVRQKGLVETLNLEKESSSRKLKQLGSLWKRKPHADWALKVKYIPDLKAIISCSPDPVDSLVFAQLDTSHKWEFQSLSITKGVNTFAFCKFPIAIVTGGTDRKIRVWNPHRFQNPMFTLKGHNSPIIDLTINNRHGHIISLSGDKVVKVWDIRNQVCIQTIINEHELRPDNLLSTVTFTDDDWGMSVITTSSSIQRYTLPKKNQIGYHPRSHNHPVRCLAYNSLFNQVISGCDGSVIGVWVLVL
jgi:WD40 repeat protein